MNLGVWVRRVAPWLGAAFLVFVLMAPAPDGLSLAGWRTLGITALMGLLWVSESIPFAATALLPLVFFPMFGICGIASAAAPFANPVIFLFLGGILIAQGMERSHIHTRLALSILRLAGTRKSSIVAAFLMASALLSMWINNTAVALLMLPIAISAIRLFRSGNEQGFCAALVLSVAYGSSIGGMATLVGTPSNAILSGFMQESYGIIVGFPLWMALALPVSLILLILAWTVLTQVAFRIDGRVSTGGDFLTAEAKKLPPLGGGGIGVLVVFFVSVALWILRGFFDARLPWLSDAGIAIVGGLALFFLPSGDAQGEALLNAKTLKKIPLDVLLLIGGGLSLAAAMQSSGLAVWIGTFAASLSDLPPLLVLGSVLCVAICLAELTSNTATTAAFLPVVGALAVGLGHSPMSLSIAVTLASSCGFMLPVSTPPNAIVYGSGHVTLPQMLRAGFLLNLGALLILTLWLGWVVPRLFDF
jgi:sodium-dependent dicarboxylate transporter 2/3/5